ncbi:choice-of-anchor Q domain-containing protein [Dokdonella soli]|uniref:Right-handed parallel beta-helix repeat-containing protein n=1 Tax=Dokdonella soli TaxID=529810 RepID=A0ABP3U574_9GAMM
MYRIDKHCAGLCALSGLLVFAPGVAASDGVVGPANCNEVGFSSVLATVDGSGGGKITFNCGAAATIAFTSYKTIANAVTIDGGGRITFDGGNASPFLQVFASASVTLRRLTLQHGVFNASHALENFGVLALDTVRVLNNSSTETPVANYGTLTVSWSTFSGNAATSSTSGDGGAIAHTGTDLHVSTSTFNGNSAARYGGAIYSNSPATIVNSTFAANAGSLGGGAFYQTGSGASSVTYTTIVGNTAPFGAGLYNDGGATSTLTIGKSIVSANSAGNCDGVLATAGYNLSNDTGCGGVFTGTGDLVNQSLPMGALANNGGPTLTMLPQAGNPAINHIPAAQCAILVDQRGAGRPSGVGCDSGAVEVGGIIDLIFADGFDG